MSRNGEIVIECDRPHCYAEHRMDADALADTRSLDALLEDNGWRRDTTSGLDICPQCREEIRDNYDGPDDGEAWSGGFAENH